ncbi:MAG TPA: SCO family protein [Streptosporangiaceae bacterium]|jgi:protein SCO1/2
MLSRTPRRAVTRTAALTLAALTLTACAASPGGAPAVVSTRSSDSPYKGVTLNGSDRVPNVALKDTSGRTYDPATHAKNRLTLLFFGYTHCPDICPTTLADLSGALRALPARTRRKINVLFVGVDTKRDTPKAMRSFLDHFDKAFVGLTGNPSKIRKAATDAHVFFQVPKNATGNYAVSHSAEVRVYGPDGRARLLFTAGTQDTDIAHDLRLLGKDLR